MDGCGGADSGARRRVLLLRVPHLLPDHLPVRLAQDQPWSERRGHRRPADGLAGPRYGAVRHPPPGSRRWTLVRQAEEVIVHFNEGGGGDPNLCAAGKQKQEITLASVSKTRREWQMERAFQTALWLLRPEIVFILGDIFDEGKWSSQKVT